MKVLVVDDEPVARNELIYLLNKYDSNLVIAEAHDMATALAILLRETFDVALLDIHLRDDSGLQLAEYINKMPKPPLLIFATAYDQYAIQAFEQDARDYLLKPYEFDRLKQAMDRAKESPTPKGTFVIEPERGDFFYNASSKEGAYYWVSFKEHGIYLFHSVPTDQQGNEIPEEAKQLGKAASHGCVRMSRADAKWFYENIPQGTTVTIK
ncbi:hypothetical protein WB05_04275 [Streptococcus agalactiae]|uniref:response regulator n=1 Tax=Streptococcus agalactiae TaxID=1311 RepID=UPI000640256B|nr:response regulator [Streptococcus agalactiae]KLJ94963.1 hypothetical protein WB05_04275 [Streptococcus agalactiae]